MTLNIYNIFKTNWDCRPISLIFIWFIRIAMDGMEKARSPNLL